MAIKNRGLPAETALHENGWSGNGDYSELCHEYANGFVAVMDVSGKIMSISERACELLGRGERELKGANWIDLCLPENIRKEIRLIIKDIVKNKVEFAVSGEVPVVTGKGDIINLSLKYNLVTGASGAVTAILFYGNEITEKQDVEEALRHANDQLIRVLIERTQAENLLMESKKEADFYLDLMSHDISNFNSNLLGNLALLERKENLSEEGNKYITACIRQVKKSENLISKVRALSMVNHVNNDMLKPVDLWEKITEALNMVRTIFPRKEVDARLLNPGDHKALATDLIDHVILNVIENAVKYTPGSYALIEVSIDSCPNSPGKFWIVKICDWGPGVDDEMKDAIFERFSRARSEKKGSGLGLSLSRAIIEKYGGRIWVEDRVKGEKEKGSAFVFTVPKAKD